MSTKKIVPYNPRWPKIFEEEAQKIKEALDKNVINIYHIGSTSVPNLAAKDKIDILLVVNDLEKSLTLEKIGYTFIGEVNVPLRYFFSKKSPNLKANIHVSEPDHEFINLNLKFRNFLRKHNEESKKYEKLKYEISKLSDAGKIINKMLPKYSIKKDEFIKSILKKAGYDGILVNFCIHEKEWSEYHRIKEEQIFKKHDTPYDKNKQNINTENHYHFCLYKGTDIAAITHIELLPNNEYSIKAIACDSPYKNQGLEDYLLKFIIEKWIVKLKNLKKN